MPGLTPESEQRARVANQWRKLAQAVGDPADILLREPHTLLQSSSQVKQRNEDLDGILKELQCFMLVSGSLSQAPLQDKPLEHC